MLAAPPADFAALPELPAGFSIAQLGRSYPFRISRSCASESGEIIVCGRRDAGQGPVAPLPDLWRGPPGDPGIPFGIDLAPNLRLGLITDQVVRPDGFIDQRVMLALRLRF